MAIQSKEPKLSLQQIAQWEANNIAIPQPYKDFLLKFNGGTVDEKNAFNIPKMKNESMLREFFGIHDGLGGLDYIMHTYITRSRCPRKYFAIGSDMLDNLILMGQDEKNMGEVFFWDHENEVVEGAKPHEKNIYKVSKDLKSFIKNLYVYKDKDDSFGPVNKLYNGSDDEIRELLTSDWEVNTQDEIKQTLIMRAAARNKIWLAKILIERSADLSNSLELAIINKHFEMMELLLKAGANTEDRNLSHYTALQEAVLDNNSEIVALLLKHGADKKVLDDLGETPLEMAYFKRNQGVDMDEVIKLLLE